MAGREGALAQHTHDDAAVGHAGSLGDIQPDHVLKQLEQGLGTAGMELLGGCLLYTSASPSGRSGRRRG